MPGTRGRSGGKNRIPVELHLARGTFKPSRHGSALMAPVPAASPVAPPDALLAGLGAGGVAFLRAIFTEYAPSVGEGLILRLAAEGLDDAAAARARGDMKAARASVRQVLAVLQRLGLPAPKAV